MDGSPTGLADQILRQLGQLRFKNLFLIVAALLLVDIAIPDVIPLIDEILLGILTIMFWSWRKPRGSPRVIEADDASEP
jgi:hypothetical protein